MRREWEGQVCTAWTIWSVTNDGPATVLSNHHVYMKKERRWGVLNFAHNYIIYNYYRR